MICSPQRAEIDVAGKKVLNFCANNYLGLSDNPRLIEAAKRAMDARGFGMSSVRFICGCQDIHKELERPSRTTSGTEDTILYAACFDANGGVFEPLLTGRDAIISDALNHASIIDGVVCQSRALPLRQRRHGRARGLPQARTGTAFPHHRDRRCLLDGRQRRAAGQDLRPWPRSTTPWSWSTSATRQVLGKTGRGITELYNLRGQVDILTGTLGKAFGGAVGGFTTAVPRSSTCCASARVPTFSNSLPPAVVGAGIEMFPHAGRERRAA